MTERKPTGVAFESWVEKRIHEAAERGEFDGLPGTGKPIPDLDRPRGELWWVKRKIEREGLSTEALLPTPLRLRKEIERLPDTVRDLPTEQAVRDVVKELNLRIVDWMRAPSGPQVVVRPIDADTVVAWWRADQAADREASRMRRPTPMHRPTTSASAGQATKAGASSRPARWWRRIARRHRRSC